MTAIAGIVAQSSNCASLSAIDRMQVQLSRFGPDGKSITKRGAVAFLRTLLRSAPEDVFDRQPLLHSPSATLLAFDGRLYNRDDLADQLNIPLPEMQYLSDADIVLRAVIRWNDDAPKYLNGDFGMAVWREAKRELWLARDPLGIRPLFWTRNREIIAFSTQATALFCIDGVSDQIDDETLHDQLCLIPNTDERSYFKQIKRVLPGAIVSFKDQEAYETRHYHRFGSGEKIRLDSDDEYASALTEQLRKAVSSRLRASGPVASHLSSGKDSAAVTAIAAEILQKRGAKLLAITTAPRIGFDGQTMKGWHADESRSACKVSDRYSNIEHHIYRHRQESFLEGLDKAMLIMGRPPLNLDNLGWVEGMTQFAADRGAKVVLTGMFGNFTASYDGIERLPSLLKKLRWLSLIQEYKGFRKNHPASVPKWFIAKTVGPFLPPLIWRALSKGSDLYWSSIQSFSAISQSSIETHGLIERAKRAGMDPNFRGYSDTVKSRIKGLNLQDPGEYALLDDAKGLQSRHPLADKQLIEFVLSIPDSQFLRTGVPNYIFKTAMREILPPEILDTKTRGQQLPEWNEIFERSRPSYSEELIRIGKSTQVRKTLNLDLLAEDLNNAGKVDGSSRENVVRFRLRLLRGLSVGRFIHQYNKQNDR